MPLHYYGGRGKQGGEGASLFHTHNEIFRLYVSLESEGNRCQLRTAQRGMSRKGRVINTVLLPFAPDSAGMRATWGHFLYLCYRCSKYCCSPFYSEAMKALYFQEASTELFSSFPFHRHSLKSTYLPERRIHQPLKC